METARHQRRLEALERLRESIQRLRSIVSPDEIIGRAAEELVANSDFDRVLISDVDGGTLTPLVLASSEGKVLNGNVARSLDDVSIQLDYPLVEAEVAQTGEGRVVDVVKLGRRSADELRRRLGWSSYVVAALRLHGRTLGLLHADATHSQRQVGDLDLELASQFADALARSYELAVLRQTLQRHRDEQWTAAHRMTERLHQLSFQGLDGELSFGGSQTAPLTTREREVLVLLGRGLTNAAIARSLTISEGTAKYHVANLLRKLGATSRADAVARHLRGVK